MCRKLLLLLMAIIFGTTAASAGIIQGRVLDAETHEPLYGAQVKVIEDNLEHRHHSHQVWQEFPPSLCNPHIPIHIGGKEETC